MPALPDVIYLPATPPQSEPDAPAGKGRAGRSGSEQRERPDVLYVRLTDSERRDIETAAEAAGMDTGAYARQMALAEPQERGSASHVTTRPTRLPFRVSAAERMKIEDAANRAGLSTGSYVRARALRHPVTLTTRRPPVEKAELGRLLGLLGNAASNVNQIARQLNTDGEVPLLDVRGAIASLQDAAGEIVSRMGRAPRERR